jgi:hypothetical protein
MINSLLKRSKIRSQILNVEPILSSFLVKVHTIAKRINEQPGAIRENALSKDEKERKIKTEGITWTQLLFSLNEMSIIEAAHF